MGYIFFDEWGYILPIGYYDTIKSWLSDSFSDMGQVWIKGRRQWRLG